MWASFSFHLFSYSYSYRLVLSIAGVGHFFAESCMWACMFKGFVARDGRIFTRMGHVGAWSWGESVTVLFGQVDVIYM